MAVLPEWRLPPDDTGNHGDAMRVIAGMVFGAAISAALWGLLLWWLW